MAETHFRNYTPHEINVRLTQDGEMKELAFPSLGQARVTETQTEIGILDGCPLRMTKYGEIVGLPPSEEGIKVIVSLLVAQANAKMTEPRQDLVSPDTGSSCIRENGQIKAVTGFVVQ